MLQVSDAAEQYFQLARSLDDEGRFIEFEINLFS